MSVILDRLNRKFQLLAEQHDEAQQKMRQRIPATVAPALPAEWKNPRSPEYDRQKAEDALFHTIGPLMQNPRWIAGPWSSPGEPVPGFQPGGPAPRWTQYELVMAFAGDPSLLFRAKDNPLSPMYGNRGGAPMFRLAKRVARFYSRDNDRSFIEDLYGNGLVALTTLMQPGFDEARSPFISFAMRNIQSAMEHGIGGSERVNRAAGTESEETGLRGMQSLLKETDPQRVREAAGVVRGKYQNTRSHDRHPDNPFGPFSSAYYQIAMNYADALESGDQDRIEAARNRMQQLIEEIEDWGTPIRGASTGLGQAISTPDRKTSIGVRSMDVTAGDDESTLAGNIPMDDSMESWIDPETMKYVLDIAINYNLGQILRSSKKWQARAIELKTDLDKTGKAKIGGPMTVTELRYVIRHMGPLGSNYPGAGRPRQNVEIPRDTQNKPWWQPGEDPEIEPIPRGGMWHSLWSRSGHPVMGPTEIGREMTQEVLEFEKLGIPIDAAKLKRVHESGAAAGKVAVSTQTASARIKLILIAEIHRQQLGLEEGVLKQLPILEGLSSIDRQLVVETCERMIRRIDMALLEVSPPGWKGTTRAMKRHSQFQKGGGANPYAIAWSMKKKGATPHYKDKEGKPEKKKQFANEGMQPVDILENPLLSEDE